MEELCMGYYEDLYNSIANPLDNDAFLDYIIDCYSDNKSIYSSVTKFNLSQKQYHRGEYYPYKRDAYWVKMFNIWKANVLAVSDSITSSPTYNPKQYFSEVDLANYLRRLPEIRTADEFWALANDDDNLIGKYGFQTVGQYTPWYHIDSAEVCFGRHRRPYPRGRKLCHLHQGRIYQENADKRVSRTEAWRQGRNGHEAA